MSLQKFSFSPRGCVQPLPLDAPLGLVNADAASGMFHCVVGNIPDGVSVSEVQELLAGTVTLLAERAGRFTFDYAELGIGVILQAEPALVGAMGASATLYCESDATALEDEALQEQQDEAADRAAADRQEPNYNALRPGDDPEFDAVAAHDTAKFQPAR